MLTMVFPDHAGLDCPSCGREDGIGMRHRPMKDGEAVEARCDGCHDVFDVVREDGGLYVEASGSYTPNEVRGVRPPRKVKHMHKTFKDHKAAELEARRVIGKATYVKTGEREDPDSEGHKYTVGHYVVKAYKPGTARYEERRAQVEAIEHLKEMLPPGSTVYTCLRQVSSSGMSRHISVHVVEDGAVRDITRWVGRALKDRVSDKTGGLVVGGCGMDMGFHVVYNLGATLYPAGFTCPGKTCRSSEHVNPPRPKRRKGMKHKGDGGYALGHQWL